MGKNKVKILKPFFAFVTVWHDKANPYNVSNYHFYVVAENEKRIENLIKRKVKTFRYYNHSTTIEEMKLDIEHQREISWQGLDDLLIQDLVNDITILSNEPMRSSVWKPRSFHHTKLLVDGLCKHRCLFKDYDDSFTSKPEDYELAKKILKRLVKSWDTNFSFENRPVSYDINPS